MKTTLYSGHHNICHQSNRHQADQWTMSEQLNCKMDTLAKEIHRFTITGKIKENQCSWSIIAGGKKLVKKQQTRLYDHILAREAIKYWQTKGKIGGRPMEINCDASGRAKKKCHFFMPMVCYKTCLWYVQHGEVPPNLEKSQPLALGVECLKM